MAATLKTTIIQEPSSSTANLTLDTSGGVTVGQNFTVTGTTTGISGRLIRAPQFLTSGTSYTTPAGCTLIVVEAWGGGGGGGGSNGNQTAGGGGGGAYAVKSFTVTGNTAYTYAIGSGGTAGAITPTAGGNGGNTTFTVGATTLTAGGGTGGATNVAGGAGGAGGTATNADYSAAGIIGGEAGLNAYGGNSPVFLGGAKATSSNDTVFNATAYGGGGGGGRGSAGPTGKIGGTGFQGAIRITEYY